jgi:hypothetical protein
MVGARTKRCLPVAREVAALVTARLHESSKERHALKKEMRLALLFSFSYSKIRFMSLQSGLH